MRDSLREVRVGRDDHVGSLVPFFRRYHFSFGKDLCAKSQSRCSSPSSASFRSASSEKPTCERRALSEPAGIARLRREQIAIVVTPPVPKSLSRPIKQQSRNEDEVQSSVLLVLRCRCSSALGALKKGKRRTIFESIRFGRIDLANPPAIRLKSFKVVERAKAQHAHDGRIRQRAEGNEEGFACAEQELDLIWSEAEQYAPSDRAWRMRESVCDEVQRVIERRRRWRRTWISE